MAPPDVTAQTHPGAAQAWFLETDSPPNHRPTLLANNCNASLATHHIGAETLACPASLALLDTNAVE